MLNSLYDDKKKKKVDDVTRPQLEGIIQKPTMTPALSSSAVSGVEFSDEVVQTNEKDIAKIQSNYGEKKPFDANKAVGAGLSALGSVTKMAAANGGISETSGEANAQTLGLATDFASTGSTIGQAIGSAIPVPGAEAIGKFGGMALGAIAGGLFGDSDKKKDEKKRRMIAAKEQREGLSRSVTQREEQQRMDEGLEQVQAEKNIRVQQLTANY